MLLHHHIHFPYLYILKNRLYEVYLYHTIEGFATSMIGIFIPIYLLTLGFTFQSVIIYFIVQNLSVLASYFVAAKVSTRYGLKHTAFMNIPFLIISLLALYALDFIQIPILLIAVIFGIYVSFRWLPLHSLFAKYSHKKHRGLEVAKLQGFPMVASIVGPVLGGAIIFLFGFSVLFITVIVVLFASVVPLFFTKEIKPHVNFSLKNFSNYFRKEMRYFLITVVFFMRNIIESLIWPVFVFLTLNDIFSIGIVGASVSIGIVLFYFVVGKLSDKVKMKTFFKVGGILMALVWFSRIIFANNPLTIYILSFLAGLFIVLHIIPHSIISYNKANQTNRDSFLLFREIGVNLGRIIGLLVAFAFIDNFSAIFSLAGIGSLLFLIY